MDECRAMGLSVKGPDVNLSRQRYSVDDEGSVRFGLAGIKGFGEGAADAVVSERKAHGPFKDVYDFVERVDLGAVNRKALESLVFSGAFDSLGQGKVRREQYVSKMPNGETFLDVLLRYGQKYRAEKQSNETSLFGDLANTEVCIVHPAVPEGASMSTLERLNLEKEYVGLYLSMHPLDEYKYQLLYACNTKMDELNLVPNPKREERPAVLADLERNPAVLEKINQLQQRDIVCGGLVTGWREGTSKAGNLYGILTVEDYSGKHEFPLFGQNYPTYRGYGKEGMYVLIHAKFQPSRFLRGPITNIFDLEFNINKIEQLDLVADNLISDFTVELDSLKVNESTVKRLQEEILQAPEEANAKAPTTSLYFDVCDAIKNYRVHLFCRTHKVRINTELVEYVCSLEGVNTCLINGHPLIREGENETEEVEDDVNKESEEELLSED